MDRLLDTPARAPDQGSSGGVQRVRAGGAARRLNQPAGCALLARKRARTNQQRAGALRQRAARQAPRRAKYPLDLVLSIGQALLISCAVVVFV
jgi:hypothetical protein